MSETNNTPKINLRQEHDSFVEQVEKLAEKHYEALISKSRTLMFGNMDEWDEKDLEEAFTKMCVYENNTTTVVYGIAYLFQHLVNKGLIECKLKLMDKEYNEEVFDLTEINGCEDTIDFYGGRITTQFVIKDEGRSDG